MNRRLEKEAEQQDPSTKEMTNWQTTESRCKKLKPEYKKENKN